MSARRLNLLILLAIAVATAPFRCVWAVPCVDGPDRGHAHHHAHVYAGEEHGHAHRHTHDDGDEDDSGDHHGLLEHAPDAPKIKWTSPRRIEVDGPPALPGSPAVGLTPAFARPPARRAKPPPGSAADHHHLIPLQTTILRL